jgi:Fe-S-cluster containining protein
VANYLHIDAENDYVLNAAPCPFLGADNYCQVYEDRPKACREYPHTNRKKIYQLLDLTLKNTSICPAAYEIVEGVKLKFSLK